MRLTQLRSFHAVAKAGSFTKAAEALHVSQPTITTQVRMLEELYHVELFYRRGRRVQLTELGERLMQVSQQIFSLESDAIEVLGDAGELRTGHLRVGAVGPHHVTKMLVHFNQRWPGVQVSVSTGNSQEVLERLLDYRADVGVLAHQVDDERLVAVPFGDYPVVIFTSSLHRFAMRQSIRLRELEGERMIMREQGSTTRRALETALGMAGVTPQVVMEIGHREIIREAVAQGIGIAAVSEAEYLPGPDTHMVRVEDADIRTYAHVLFLEERRESRMVRAFLDAVAQVAPK